MKDILFKFLKGITLFYVMIAWLIVIIRNYNIYYPIYFIFTYYYCF